MRLAQAIFASQSRRTQYQLVNLRSKFAVSPQRPGYRPMSAFQVYVSTRPNQQYSRRSYATYFTLKGLQWVIRLTCRWNGERSIIVIVSLTFRLELPQKLGWRVGGITAV